MSEEVENKQEELTESVESTKESSTSEEQSQEQSVEEQAKLQGWDPKGELSAAEFVRRGDLFKKIHSQSSQIRELKDTLTKLSSHIETAERAAYDRGLKSIEQQRDQAILTGDLDTVKNLDQQAELMKKQQENVKLTPSAVPFTDEEVAFADRNKVWFNADPSNTELVSAAIFFDNYLLTNRKDLDRDSMLKMVEDRIKKLYPDKFSNPRKSSPSPVMTSTTSSKDSKSSKLVERLTSQQRDVGEQFMRSIPGYTLEKYAKELDKQGNLGK